MMCFGLLLTMLVASVLIIGCTPPAFELGEVVCHKLGGPKGVVANNGPVDVYVTFYCGSGSGGISIGGQGLLVGGDANGSTMFPSQWFKEFELLHEKDCGGR